MIDKFFLPGFVAGVIAVVVIVCIKEYRIKKIKDTLSDVCREHWEMKNASSI